MIGTPNLENILYTYVIIEVSHKIYWQAQVR